MKKAKIYGLVLLFVFVSFNVVNAVAEGGEENDPLITQSYMEMRIEQVKTYFEEKLKASNPNAGNTSMDKESGASVFEPVTVNAGSYLIGGKGTEVILRTGDAKAVANAEGGIVDVTAGLDIQSGKEIPKQHLLIIPREDGRGLSISNKGNAVIMIKGTYKIQ